MVMNDRLILDKFTLVITTRCNLKCRLCCEYVVQNKPFPDMTIDEEKAILAAFFGVVDRVDTLHLSGGGEPFLHKNLAEMVDSAFEYNEYFDRFMLFTNSTIPVSDRLLDALKRHKEKTVVHASDYGLFPERAAALYKTLSDNDVNFRVVKYYGAEQDFGGWVDFGTWEPRERKPGELEQIFRDCAVTRDMRGNWRTRDGKVHWCSRSQRGMELGYLPDDPGDYVDLFDSTNRQEKRKKFQRIKNSKSLLACDYCSGEQGTSDAVKRIPAAEQI